MHFVAMSCARIYILSGFKKKEKFYLTTKSTYFIYGYMDGREEIFYLTTHSTHFYGYMASDIW